MYNPKSLIGVIKIFTSLFLDQKIQDLLGPIKDPTCKKNSIKLHYSINPLKLFSHFMYILYKAIKKVLDYKTTKK